MSPAIPRLLLTFCALGLLLTLPSRAERKVLPAIGVAPPQPMDLNLRIRREGKTEIPLRIYGRANEPLKYLIRVPPDHGKVSEPRATEREVSVVIYEPPADLAITTDKFFYAVQNGVGVSAAVQVNITIVDQPPQLTIPDSIDFSTVRSGATASRMLEISNHGGLIATGEVIVQPPWKIEGKTGYQLRADEVAVFKIVFSPVEGGKFERVARFTSDPEHSTTLRGVAEAPIVFDPATWILEQTPGDPRRAGSFELTNQLDEPRTLQLKTDPRLKIPAQIQLPPHGKAKVILEAPPADVQGWDTEVRLTSEDFSVAVPVRVPTLDAIIRPNTETIAYGRLAMGKNAVTHFELENIGGVPGKVSWEIGAPFHAEDNTATLKPGEKKSFPLDLATKTAGRYRTWLQFTAGTQTFDLPVQAEVVSNQSPSFSAPAVSNFSPPSANQPETGVPDPSILPLNPLADMAPAVPPDWYGDLNPPKGVRVRDITPTSAIIEWPASLSPAAHFRVEMEQFRVGPDGKPRVSWLQPTGIPIEIRGTSYVAILQGLQPAQPWTVRIIPLEASGEAGDRLFAVDFATPPKPTFAARHPGFTVTRCLLVMLGILLAAQGWRRWQRRGSTVT